MLLFVLLYSSFLQAGTIGSLDFKWFRNLKEKGVTEINVCGNADILNSKKSLRKDFLLGNPKMGLVFSHLPSKDS